VNLRFTALAAGCAVVILGGAVLGMTVGSHPIPAATVIEALTDFDPTNNAHLIVVHSRLPRTALALLVGVSLGLAGLLMQSITRNPLADPGLFAVNAGASAAVVAAIILGVATPAGYVWFAFAGAALASVAVFLLGTARRSAATPVRMALAGAAISVALAAVTDMVLLSHDTLFNQFRFWAVGSLQGRGLDVAAVVAPFLSVGVLLALVLARPLNVTALGDDAARGLGARPGLIRAGAALAVVLLAGGATAAAGPIGFVGLAAPHIVRTVVGNDHRYLVPGVLLTAPAFLLLADVAGRWIVAPAELQTGLAAAVLGGPIFVAIVRSKRMSAL
jgi:iron complex transport system permease protein